jgi:uncharacterized protein (DUF1697 family)
MAATTTYIAFLRGINVGRAKQVAMADLAAAFESLGHEHVRTVLRSGNVVFDAPTGKTEAIATALERAIEERTGVSSRVVLRTADELQDVIDANPIPEAADHGAALHVMFLAEPLTSTQREALEHDEFPPDVVRPARREIYVWYRNGMAGSKTAEQLDRRLNVLATDRNWNTITRLSELARRG